MITIIIGTIALPTLIGALQYWIMVQIILGFWFGGRLVTKDIPAALGYLRK